MQKWRHFRRSHGRNHSEVTASMALTAVSSLSMVGMQPPLQQPHQSPPHPIPVAHRRTASGGRPFTLRSNNQMNSNGVMNLGVSIAGTPTMVDAMQPHHRRQRSHQPVTGGIVGLYPGQDNMDLT